MGLNVCDYESDIYVAGTVVLAQMGALVLVLEGPGLACMILVLQYCLCRCWAGPKLDAFWNVCAYLVVSPMPYNYGWV